MNVIFCFSFVSSARLVRVEDAAELEKFATEERQPVDTTPNGADPTIESIQVCLNCAYSIFVKYEKKRKKIEKIIFEFSPKSYQSTDDEDDDEDEEGEMDDDEEDGEEDDEEEE